MILTGKLFKLRYAVGGSVQPPLVIYAANMSEADSEALLYASEQPGYEGAEVRILSANEIDLGAL